MYAAFGMEGGYDTSLSASAQFYDEANGITYADYFLDTAIQQLQQVAILCAEAEAAGYTLSEEGQAIFDQNMNYLTMYSVQQMMDEESYLKMLYGRDMTMDLFQKVLTDSILAEEYAQLKANEFTYSAGELEDYYSENTDAMDSYDFRYCYIDYQVEEKTDEEGNTIAATDEEIAAAMDVAKENAAAMIAQVKEGAAFNSTAAQYLDETTASAYSSDAEYNHRTDVLGSELATSIIADAGTWLMEAGRTAGDITSIEMENSGYCVVQFLGREKGEDTYQTMDYRAIVVMAETDFNEDGTAALPTDEQNTSAKDQAEELLAQWKEGDGDAESFAALASQESDDEATKDNGGLVEDADRSLIAASLADWLFADGRKVGDAAVVSYTDDTGNVVGYQVVFAEDFGEIRWEYAAANALRTEDYNAWYAELQESYPAELTEDGKTIPGL